MCFCQASYLFLACLTRLTRHAGGAAIRPARDGQDVAGEGARVQHQRHFPQGEVVGSAVTLETKIIAHVQLPYCWYVYHCTHVSIVTLAVAFSCALKKLRYSYYYYCYYCRCKCSAGECASRLLLLLLLCVLCVLCTACVFFCSAVSVSGSVRILLALIKVLKLLKLLKLLIHSHFRYRLNWSECSWAPCWWPFFLCVQVVASAIVDKYIGESARVVREMFGYAKVRGGAIGAAQKYGLRSGGTDSCTPLRQSQRVTLVTPRTVKATG